MIMSSDENKGCNVASPIRVSKGPRTVNAAIYARISDDREGEALGVKRQEEDCRALAARRGWLVAAVYIDNDRSAYSGKPRPEYERLMADIRNGAVDAVVVWDLDRLHRSPRELEDFFAVCDSARPALTELASVSGAIDLSTHMGRLNARMMGSVARYESDHKSARLRRKHEQLAQMGRISGGGHRPFGYEDDRRTIRTSEAKLIREGARRVLAGESLRSIVRLWNDAGSTTTAGRAWYASAAKRVLVSARIAGLREHHHEVVAKGEWPGIIPRAQSERLRLVLRDPARRTNVRKREYLLSGGLLRCGLCGTRLYARPKLGGVPCYVCASGPGFKGCGKIRRLAVPVESLISEAVIYRLDSPALAKAVAAEEKQLRGRDKVIESAGEIEAQQAELAREWGAGRLARAEWLAARDALQRRLDALHAQLRVEQRSAAVKGLVGRSKVLAKRWPSLSVEQRRAIVAAVLDHARVLPARKGFNRFDPTRFELVWRV